jgi:hypothetical protein
MRAAPFSTEEVLMLVKRYPGARGVRRLRGALPLVDGGAASPKETWLRLLLIDAGFPVPTTQIPVLDGYAVVACSTWAGKSTRWPPSTTAINTEATEGGTSRIFGDMSSSRAAAGTWFGWCPKTGRTMSSTVSIAH